MYGRIGKPVFYIDAVLLARKWGVAEETPSTAGKFHLNPVKVTDFTISSSTGKKFISVDLPTHWLDSLTDFFVLGHELYANSHDIRVKFDLLNGDTTSGDNVLESFSELHNGWSKFNLGVCAIRGNRLVVAIEGNQNDTFRLGDFSACWKWEAPNTPDQDLTRGYVNETVKHTTTPSGHTLSNSGYNQQPKWILDAWERSYETGGFTSGAVGRRKWNFKFSYVDDTKLFPDYYSNPLLENNTQFGIFSGIDIVKVKDDFISKVYHGTNGFELPFIFQPNSDLDDFAICRIMNKDINPVQVSHNLYEVNFDIIEQF